MPRKNGNAPARPRRAPNAVQIGKTDSAENTAPHRRLQAARLLAKLRVSLPVAFAIVALAYPEARP